MGEGRERGGKGDECEQLERKKKERERGGGEGVAPRPACVGRHGGVVGESFFMDRTAWGPGHRRRVFTPHARTMRAI